MPTGDVDVRAVAWIGLAIATTLAVVICAVFLLLHVWRVAPGADRLRLPYTIVIDGPALQSAPQPELGAERAAQARLLRTSGWVDDAHGIVRIPIAAAMRVLVEQGRAPGGAALATPAAPPSAPTVGTTSESGNTR